MFDPTVSTKELRALLADVFVAKHVMYGVHWHVRGQGFLEIHRFSQEIYEYLVEQYDEVAERIIQIGEAVPTAYSDHHEHATLKKVEHEFIDVKTGWRLMKDALTHLSESAHKHHAELDKAGDTTSVVIVEDILEDVDKFLWLTSSSL